MARTDRPRRFDLGIDEREAKSLEWYFRVPSERGLPKKDAERWRRISNALEGNEVCLRRYYLNPWGLREPLLGVDPEWDEDAMRRLDDVIARRVESRDEREYFEVRRYSASQRVLREFRNWCARKNGDFSGDATAKEALRACEAREEGRRAPDDVPQLGYEEISVNTAAELLGVDRASVYRLIESGKLKRGRPGYVRLNRADVGRRARPAGIGSKANSGEIIERRKKTKGALTD